MGDITVIIGNIAFLNACFITILKGETPLEIASLI